MTVALWGEGGKGKGKGGGEGRELELGRRVGTLAPVLSY